VFTINSKVDPNSKVRADIDDALDAGTYVPADLAHRLVDKLREENPELLREWLDGQAVDMMREAINRVNQSRRAITRHRSGAVAFKTATDRAEAGDPRLLEGWLDQSYPTNIQNVRKPLTDMYRTEVLYAASIHTRIARGNQMQAAFLKVIAEQLGARKVGEVFDNDQLDALWTRLGLDPSD